MWTVMNTSRWLSVATLCQIHHLGARKGIRHMQHFDDMPINLLPQKRILLQSYAIADP
jgi:hypothetical protein